MDWGQYQKNQGLDFIMRIQRAEEGILTQEQVDPSFDMGLNDRLGLVSQGMEEWVG